MKKFMAIYLSPASAMAQMANISPEEKAKGMEPWMQWNAKYGDAIVDLGAPLMGGQALNTSGEWSGSNNEVSGYSIVQGESEEAVKAMFVGHPHLSWAPGCAVEIHECVAM